MKVSFEINWKKTLELTLPLVLALMVGILITVKATNSYVERVTERETETWEFVVAVHNALDVIRLDCAERDDARRCASAIYFVQKMIQSYSIENFPGDVMKVDSTQASNYKIVYNLE